MKKMLVSGLLLALLSVTGCERAAQHPEDLPWQSVLTPAGDTQVFHLEIGKSTLKDVINQLHSFPELAVFTQENGKRTLEAYFGTQRIGLFEAKIIAELKADPTLLEKFEAEHTKREGMASGLWKYTLSESNIKIADGLLVHKLIYMPAINYEPEIISARFGEPTERLPSSKQDVEYWFYPNKGLAILLNSKGGEILYYTNQQDYTALKQELLEAKPRNE